MNWMIFSPELYLLIVAAVFFGRSLVTRSEPGQDYFIALVLASVGLGVCLASVRLEGSLFWQTYRVDLFSQVFKVMLSMGFFLVVCLCAELNGIEKRHHPEFYLLLTICTLAMMLLVSSVHLLTIYIALELSSYSLYILVSLRKGRRRAIDAGLKYFLIGASASAVMLFGFALLYGSIQATYLVEVIQVLPGALNRPVVAIGLVLTLCGFFFKLAVFPFHFWAPDVYEGAANQVATYIATASKAAAIAILMRTVALSGAGSAYLVHILVTLSIVSMTVGNLTAIVQRDLKRLLAYSSIAHAGYVLIGILSMNQAGYASAIFYALSLLVMKFTCFLVVVKVADDGRNLNVEHLAGLHRRSPILAMALMLALFGLAGIPPTIGFTGKLLIFTAAMEKGYFFLVLIAMINVVISLYYYLLVLKAAYLLEPETELPELQISPSIKVLAGALISVMIGAGFFPTYLIELAKAAAQVLM
ncbi:MAG: NADH-quinone oxidoreductase subunit N [Pseudomonadota bacterium]|uniref:NADH-quinone oxidoreductase subunit N n=1 Tax=Candidatus Desulfatibia profunda TaxID=2841695 RepID=A0A8J6TJF2_9BACT|nr:NADH-quinone oxidoreductase subunit N [Candidatus Desulfatibia profunda]MBU0698391.1 NADH-quinone oxidoreductase subunit N [Pseudomonadota bacterium]